MMRKRWRNQNSSIYVLIMTVKIDICNIKNNNRDVKLTKF